MKVADTFHEMRTSNCSTSYYRSPVGGDKDCWRGIDNGYIEGGVAYSVADQEYTGARVCIVNNEMDPAQPEPVIDFRLCIFDLETKALRAISYNLAAELNASPRKPNFPEGSVDFPAEPEGIFVDLSDGMTPVAISLRDGEPVILATALYGHHTSRNVVIINGVCNKAMMARDPQLGFNRKSEVIPAPPSTVPPGDDLPSGDFVGWEPGQMLTIGSEPSGNYPDMELVPFRP